MQKLMAVPLRGTVWGLPGALSAKLSRADRAAPAEPHVVEGRGLKDAWMVQLFPGTMLAPVQLSEVVTKSPALAPVLVTDEIASVPANGPELLFVTTIGCGELPAPPASWAPKLMLMGTEIPACVAVPVRVIDDGVTVGRLRVATRDPGVVGAGVNMTLSWQLCPAGTVHEEGVEKSLAFGPVMLTLPTCAGEAPEFAIVMVWPGLDAPSLCAANVRLAGEA